MIFGKYINRYYLKYAWILLVGLAALVLVDYFQLEVPELYRMVVNGINTGVVETAEGTVPFDLNFLLDKICLPLIIIILVMVVGRFTWRICFFGTGIRVETSIRDRMFDHCKDLSAQYYQVNKVGNLMSLFTNDLETIQECFGSGIMMMCDAAFLGILTVVKMWRMDVGLTLLALIPMALLLASGIIVGKYMTKKWETRQAAFSDLSDFSQESFSGIAVIKAFVKETKELLAFRRLNKRNKEVNVSYTKASTLLNITVTLFVESVICIILGYGGYLVYQEQFNAGQLVEYIGYFTAMVWPVMAVSQLIEMTSRGKASLNRVSELLDAKQDVVDKPDVEDVKDIEGRIEFRHLTFRYPDGEFDVLKDVSFTIEPGENVGLVGKTGSGKTTIVDLILRTYNVPDGTVFLDGHDVNTIPIRDVRAAAAYVPQDNFLFSDTIENNIAFAYEGEQAAEAEAAEEAARLAAVHDNIVDFKDKYMTMLGERGVTVSGGQKQRISIARALMKHAKILILDDSVSAVDTKTEQEILTNLRKNRAGLTTILIAHRISTVEDMDKIVFIDDGRVVDVGTHDELVLRCPDYKKMVDLQKLEDEGRQHNA
ncbi:MAG TPA: ABC transporter ATP-binding protein/permease [Candidatus Gallimonas gallistercoris]|uniref:ABC transporter ATP-binding protein/permease n=1 Tax=Candidatus Gallimonas gallistercoris TaxID=2838602 RepID=A0A9D2KFM5_9FIRM|nr:ABC transporter ATP-binding protein/permease [Candidatus Gallimonas gallistercoris]